MKNFVSLCAVLGLLACSDEADKNQLPQQNFDDFSGVSFEITNSYSTCNVNSNIVCAINDYIACSINPKHLYCEKNKNVLPAFVFMEDDNLKRPTVHKYQIAKMKMRPDNLLEVYTTSECDGNWFGLCQGNIIFVLKNINNNWFVVDAYARENF